MKKYLSTIFIVIVFAVGLLVMFYPNISNWYNEKMSSYVVSHYAGITDYVDEEKCAKMLQDASDYNASLHSEGMEFVSGEVQDATYKETLDVYNGMMGYIFIEDMDIELPIMHGTDADVLQTSVGHLEGSSLPTGELGNHTVLTGHTGLPSAELFTRLTDMEVGDTFELHILNQVFTYEVFNITVVEPYKVDDLENVEDKDMVTLITCTPYGVNSHRLLVQGEQIEAGQVEEQEEISEVYEDATDTSLEHDYTLYIICAVIIVLLVLINIILFLNYRHEKKQYRRKRYEKFKKEKKDRKESLK